jgi:hypothetical protein
MVGLASRSSFLFEHDVFGNRIPLFRIMLKALAFAARTGEIRRG